MRWHTIEPPTGAAAVIPAGIKLDFPTEPTLTLQQCRATAYIPWDEKYLRHVPKDYQKFFCYVLPHLARRTTNVHTALSVAQIPFLLAHAGGAVDARTAYLAVILHDAGWSKVSLQGVADSLSYSGLTLSETSQLPKEQHVLIGAAMAYDLLDNFDFGDQPVLEATKRHISQIIRRHDYDAPWEQGKYPILSLETQLVCDADRLWSYTHENFWQDTVRKSVDPEDYLVTLTGSIDSYFITAAGRVRAHGLIADRRAEVKLLAAHLREQRQLSRSNHKV